MPRNGTRLPPSCPLCKVCSGFHFKQDDFQSIFSNDGRSVDRVDSFNPGLVVDIKRRAETCQLCWLIVRAVEDCGVNDLKDDRFYEARLKWPFVSLKLHNALPRGC